MIRTFKSADTEDIFDGMTSREARRCCPQSIWPVARRKLDQINRVREITTDVGRRLPRNRPPTHPGEMLLEEFVKPLDLTQEELARLLDVSYPRLNEIIKGRRSVTPDTALRLSRVLGMSADFWLGLQQDWDLCNAMNSPEAKQINRLKPFSRDRHSFS